MPSVFQDLETDAAATKTSVAAIDTKTPALVSGRVPVEVQAGLATAAAQGSAQATLEAVAASAAASATSVDNLDDKTPALVSGRVPVEVQAGLETEAAATAVSVASIDAKTPPLAADPVQDGDAAVPIAARPQRVDRIGFMKAIANNVDTDWATLRQTGPGMTVNQTGGNLVLTTGTTTRAETIIRSNATVQGGMRLRVRSTLSQRIVNQTFFAELVDVVGDGLTYTITSATSMTVTIPSNPFTAQNVGQSVYAGGFAGTGTFLSGRYTIASVSGNDVVFTVSGFAAGTGTLSLFGWNYYHLVYDGTTATNAKFDCQRNGYASGDTTLTTLTSAAPGHIVIITGNDTVALVTDELVASSGGARVNLRGSRSEMVPDDAALRLQIRVLNGTTAPASTTTWTIGAISISQFSALDTVIQDTRQGTNTPVQVEVMRSPTVAVSGTVTANQGTFQAGTAYSLTTAATTNAASVKASAGNLFELTISNPTATATFVKLYNKASAPTVGTDIPVLTIPVAAGAAVTIQGGTIGKRFATGIALAATAAAAATDTGATVAGIQIHGTYV